MSQYIRFSAELADRICDDLANGRSLRAICDQPDMPARKTVFAWLKERPEFLEAYQDARERQAEFYADQIVEIADTCADPIKARLQIDSRKWVASKLLPKKYGDRIQHDAGEATTLIVSWMDGTQIAETKMIEHEATSDGNCPTPPDFAVGSDKRPRDVWD